jgi:23S rRNA (guanosine2251-2'-O)-methyltransferase
LWLIGLEADGEAAFDSVDYTGPVAMVIGSEGKGLRPLVRRHCDEVVKLAIGGHAGSLNASVAAAIVLYEVFRQREKK